MQAFYCNHNNHEEAKKRGVGVAIGQTVVTNPTTGEPSIWISVLWDNYREISPDLHAPSELSWIALVDQYDNDDEEVEEEEETDTDEVLHETEDAEIIDGNFTDTDEDENTLDH